MIDFLYGAGARYINITNAVLQSCTYGNHVFIPAGDLVRASLFPDPAHEDLKSILVIRGEVGERTCSGFDALTPVDLRLTPEEMSATASSRKYVPPTVPSADDKLRQIHAELQFVGGNIDEEWAEQRLTVKYLSSTANVLEIGSHVGRNSLNISSLLDDDKTFVAMECDPAAVETLQANRDSNNRHFNIEPAALSYRRLVQRGWDTIPSDASPDGYRAVQTIGYDELEAKYSITFDTLVLDCSGAIYYVLRDKPEILQNISTIISQSDYRSTEHKKWVDDLLLKTGFERVCSEPLLSREWLPAPDECQESYYEVWKK